MSLPSTPLITPQPLPDIPSGHAPLAHLGVIQITGADAASFIHGQLSNDFVLLPDGGTRLAALCTAKGRMQASFIGIRANSSDIRLVCSRDLLAPTLKRLSMFVLRAEAKLRDATEDFALWGLSGQACLPMPHNTPWTCARVGNADLVQLYPACGQARQLWMGPGGEAPPPAALLDAQQWALGEVLSGLATVSAAVVEAFVPQMLNYESVDGVSFKKGCYPGQEIVARSQFRGTLKRRAYILVGDAKAILAPGQALFSSLDAEQACGTVVQIAQAPTGQQFCIASLQTEAAAQGFLHAGSAQGPALHIVPLPYALREDI